jgi:sialate O-acetylesterase
LIDFNLFPALRGQVTMLRKTMTLLFSYALLSITSIAEAEQNLELAAPFTNNMILQRQTDVPVWGFDTPGAKITVEFAGQSKTAVVNQYGDWMVKLDPLEVSRAGRQMKVTNDRSESIILDGALVGEVWFSSGQSNMVWTAGKSMCGDLAFGEGHSDSRD